MPDVHLGSDHPDFEEARTIALRLIAGAGLSAERSQVASAEVSETVNWIGDDPERLGLVLWWLSGISGVLVQLVEDGSDLTGPDVLAVIENTLEGLEWSGPDEV